MRERERKRKVVFFPLVRNHLYFLFTTEYEFIQANKLPCIRFTKVDNYQFPYTLRPFNWPTHPISMSCSWFTLNKWQTQNYFIWPKEKHIKRLVMFWKISPSFISFQFSFNSILLFFYFKKNFRFSLFFPFFAFFAISGDRKNVQRFFNIYLFLYFQNCFQSIFPHASTGRLIFFFFSFFINYFAYQYLLEQINFLFLLKLNSALPTANYRISTGTRWRVRGAVRVTHFHIEQWKEGKRKCNREAGKDPIF